MARVSGGVRQRKWAELKSFLQDLCSASKKQDLPPIIVPEDLEMVEFIGEALEFLFRLVFAILCASTGEIVLFLLTLGRHKPRWDLYAKDPSGRFVIFSEIGLWIGVALWLSVILISPKLLGQH